LLFVASDETSCPKLEDVDAVVGVLGEDVAGEMKGPNESNIFLEFLKQTELETKIKNLFKILRYLKIPIRTNLKKLYKVD